MCSSGVIFYRVVKTNKPMVKRGGDVEILVSLKTKCAAAFWIIWRGLSTHAASSQADCGAREGSNPLNVIEYKPTGSSDRCNVCLE